MKKEKSFLGILKTFSKDYPNEVQVCCHALDSYKKKLKKKVKDLEIQLTGVPEKGLFGEELQQPILQEIQKLERKIGSL